MSLPHCATCRWVGAPRSGFDSRFSRCLHQTSLWHQLSCLLARSGAIWGESTDICGELGRHWEPRDRGEPVEAEVDSPRPGREGAEAEPA